MRILVIEDNSDIAANLGDFLEDRGHTVDFAGDGVTGLHRAVVDDFDAIILDLNLPGMDGLEVCRKLRQTHASDAGAHAHARDALEQKIAGFESGSDDYLVKPFALQEVEARGRAAASRRGMRRACSMSPIWNTTSTRSTWCVPASSHLNPTALKILSALMEARRQVVTRQELETASGRGNARFRKPARAHPRPARCGRQAVRQALIQTRHGIGYRIGTSTPRR